MLKFATDDYTSLSRGSVKSSAWEKVRESQHINAVAAEEPGEKQNKKKNFFVECAVSVVKDRMEHSGMRWTMAGAHAMLELRSIQLSGLWDKFVKDWKQRENQRLYPHNAANDGVFDHAAVA